MKLCFLVSGWSLNSGDFLLAEDEILPYLEHHVILKKKKKFLYVPNMNSLKGLISNQFTLLGNIVSPLI